MNINVLKIFILCGSIVAVFGRSNIKLDYVNYYMAVINVASFIVSYNILLIDIYAKLKQSYHMHKDNSIKINSEKIVMMVYIASFVINIVIWGLLLKIYFLDRFDYALVNDILGISSLSLALTSDFVSSFVEKILTYFFISGE